MEPEKLSRDELKNKLRSKIKDKQISRNNVITKDKSENLNESVKKIATILSEKGIDSPDKIDKDLIEIIMSILSKNDLDILTSKLSDNTKLKNMLSNISEKLANKEINKISEIIENVEIDKISEIIESAEVDGNSIIDESLDDSVKPKSKSRKPRPRKKR